MRRMFLLAGLFSLLLLAVPGITQASGPEQDTLFPGRLAGGPELVIYSATDTKVFQPVIEAYQAEHPGVAIRYHEVTTNMLDVEAETACRNRAFLADIVFSSAVDLQVKLVNDGCARSLPDTLPRLLPRFANWRNELFGLTYEPAVIVYNKKLVAPGEVPKDHFGLLDLLRQPDRFKGKIGTYDIESSGLGYLYATLDSQQSSTWGRLIEAMGRNQVKLFCCTSDILDRVADGRLALGYNVLGSYALGEAERQPDLGVVLPSDYTLVLTRAAFVPKAARQPETAENFLVFTQSPRGRAILTAKARLFSPVDGMETVVQLMGLASDAVQPLRPISLGPVLLTGLDRMKRRLFLRQWREAMALGEDRD